MIIEIKIPSPGESITEIEIARWFVEDGDIVLKDQEIAEIESEKATLPLIASEEGEIKIIAKTGVSIAVGAVACKIDTSKKSMKKKPIKNAGISSEQHSKPSHEEKEVITSLNTELRPEKEILPSKIKVTPVAKKMMDDNKLTAEDILKSLKKITSKEVNAVLNSTLNMKHEYDTGKDYRTENRVRMSVLRRKLSQRLVSVKNETAMLTTFNEVDMSVIMEMRRKYQDEFHTKHGVKLGLMSFFTKAVSISLKAFPMVNSRIDGDDIITPSYTDIGIAVQTEKGLMVPVLRNVEKMSFADIERKISELSTKARSNKISIEEMTGGSFTITNGGIFGSMMSTPILNPPQSAILGMHKIMERPVARNGQVVIRPMMYLALSYDHRIVDGRESVSFLVMIKEMIEKPEKMLFAGNDPEKLLLNL